MKLKMEANTIRTESNYLAGLNEISSPICLDLTWEGWRGEHLNMQEKMVPTYENTVKD